MFKLLRQSILVFLALTLLLGVAYPLVMTLIAQGVFPRQANGSLVERDGKAIGSALIGQQFNDPRYFWSRPSATGPTPYNSTASTGSNYGPTNPAQLEAVQARVDAIKQSRSDGAASIPIDMVTASASGLDPHISPAAAEYQLSRVAAARGIDVEQLREVVADHVEGRTLGLLGEPRVNVLQLNLALDNVGATNPNESTAMWRWPRKMWHLLIDWLLEPIEFPGMWDINEPQRTPSMSKSYNCGKDAVDEVRELDG